MLEILRSIFKLWYYPSQSTEEERKECRKLIRNRANGIMILSCVVFIYLIIILCVCFVKLSDDTHNTIILYWKVSDLLWVSFGSTLLFCLSVFVYALGVGKHWKLKEESEYVDIRHIQKLFNERYELDNRRCSECEKYSDTGKLIVNAMENFSHSRFVSFFKKATGSTIEELNLIRDDFSKEQRYAKLLCVLSNPAYFSPNSNVGQLEQLTHYFITFYIYINDQKRIKRIFSLSAIGNENDSEYEEKAKWLFQYLLINYITGVETCLLVDEKGLKIHVDYVVGKYPGGEYRLYSKRKSYFSYEVEQEKDKDYTIQCSDQLFTNILETDFYERWKGLKANKSERERIYVEGNWDKIMEKIHLDRNDVKMVFHTLSTHINSCKDGYFTDQDRMALFDELLKVACDRSLKMDKSDKEYLIKDIKVLKYKK